MTARAICVCILQCLALCGARHEIKTEYADQPFPWPEEDMDDTILQLFMAMRGGSTDPSTLQSSVHQRPQYHLVHLEFSSRLMGTPQYAKAASHAALAYIGGTAIGDLSTAGIGVYNIAHILVERGQSYEATRQIQAELTQLPWGQVKPLTTLSARELLELADELMATSQSAGPMRNSARALLTKLLVANHDFDGARAVATKHLEANPSDVMVINEIAISYITQGRAELAVPWWIRALQAAVDTGNKDMTTISFNNLMTRLPVEMVLSDTSSSWPSVDPRSVQQLRALYGQQYERLVTAASKLHTPGDHLGDVSPVLSTVYAFMNVRKALVVGLHWQRLQELEEAILAVLNWCTDMILTSAMCAEGRPCPQQRAATACLSSADMVWHPYWFVHFSTAVLPWSARRTSIVQRARRPRTVHLPRRQSPAPLRRPLVTGIYSYDFREHAFGYIVEGWLRSFDQNRSKLRLLALEGPGTLGLPGHETRQAERLRHLCDAKQCEHEAIRTATSVDAAAAQIASRPIDIFVDAMGPTFGARSEIAGLRPGPVAILQNTPCSSLTADATTTDTVIAPPEDLWSLGHATADARAVVRSYVEPRAVYMPRTWFLSSFTTEAECGQGRIMRCGRKLGRSRMMLGALMSLDKWDPIGFTAWMNIMRRHPRTLLVVRGDRGSKPMARLAAEMAAHGVHPSRIYYRLHMPNARHVMDMGARLDLFLDTWVCNGHTTAAEALWAGVPTLTLEGQHLHNRVASSLLQASGSGLDRPTVARTAGAYEAMADELLAAGGSRLQPLRQRFLRATAHGFAVRAQTQIQDVERAHRLLVDSVALEVAAEVLPLQFQPGA